MAESKGVQAWLYQRNAVPRQPAASVAASLAQGLASVSQADLPVDSLGELGFTQAGPAACGFLDWVAAQANADGVDHILFAAQSGRVMQAVAEQQRHLELPGLPEFSHLPGSEMDFILAGMNEANYAAQLPLLIATAEGLSLVQWLQGMGAEIPAEHVLRDFGIAGTSVLQRPPPKPVLEFLLAWRWNILKICRSSRRALLERITAGGLRPGHRVAFVDIGWDGAAQEAFENAVRDLVTLHIAGYYLCLTGSQACRQRRGRLRMKSLNGPENWPVAVLDAAYENRAVAARLFAASLSRDPGRDPGDNGPAAVLGREAAKNSGLGRGGDSIEYGVRAFARQFQKLQTSIGVRPDPFGQAAPLVDFIAGEDWTRDPRLQGLRNDAESRARPVS